ncbi:MAG: 50S ribosomal protein L19, partial [Akkermansiaceae bacterium]|nr:50S ribosomal protein L19 [Verrucomicrobiales bacterium]
MNPIIKEITANQVKANVTSFKVGDGVKVHTKVREGDKERVQVFAGVVIARKGSG